MVKKNMNSSKAKMTDTDRAGGPDDTRSKSKKAQKSVREDGADAFRAGGPDDTRSKSKAERNESPQSLPNTARGGIDQSRG